MLYVYMWRKIEFFTISPRQHASSSKQQGNSLEMMGVEYDGNDGLLIQ